MTINISCASVISEIRQKSHFETQNIQDAAVRERTRAGLEKEDEVGRCLVVADAQLRSLLTRYLVTTPADAVSAEIGVPVSLVYVLGFAERRDFNKSVELPQMMRDYLVSASLSKYYATVSATELAAKRGNEAAAMGTEIIRIMFHKNPPIL